MVGKRILSPRAATMGWRRRPTDIDGPCSHGTMYVKHGTTGYLHSNFAAPPAVSHATIRQTSVADLVEIYVAIMIFWIRLDSCWM